LRSSAAVLDGALLKCRFRAAPGGQLLGGPPEGHLAARTSRARSALRSGSGVDGYLDEGPRSTN
jgi:hypothetical protein